MKTLVSDSLLLVPHSHSRSSTYNAPAFSICASSQPRLLLAMPFAAGGAGAGAGAGAAPGPGPDLTPTAATDPGPDPEALGALTALPLLTLTRCCALDDGPPAIQRPS